MGLFWECASAKLYQGDCRDVMLELPDESVDSIVTDPPYHLTAGKKGGSGEASRVGSGNPFGKSYAPTGFMGKSWDGGDVAFQPETWAKAMRVLKPGGYLLAFGGTRTYHRLVCAIEDAGFEIRDSISWNFASGFPKSLNVAMAIDKAARGVPQGGSDPTSPNHGNYKGGCSEDNPTGQGFGAGPGQFMKDSRSKYDGANRKSAPSTTNGFGYENKGEVIDYQPFVEDAKKWAGWGTALKPAMELIVVARKPLSESTVAGNVLKYGTGAINIDACRIPGEPVPINRLERWSGFGQEKQPEYEQEINSLGRWPSNVIHDGSEEVLALFPDTASGVAVQRNGGGQKIGGNGIYSGSAGLTRDDMGYDDSGSAARYFYCAKASQEDRNEGLEAHYEVKIGWGNADQRAVLRVDTAQSPPRVIAVSGTPNNSVTEWNTMLFGSCTTDQSLKALMYTTAMKTSSTMPSAIWNCLQNFITSENTLVVNCETENGGSLVESVNSGAVFQMDTTSEKMASALGVSNAALPMRLTVSVCAAESGHPTVKPTDLMRYLCRLVTPPNGTILDPFTGSGSTGKAALYEGFNFIGIEGEKEYCAISKARMEFVLETDSPLFRAVLG